MIVVRNQVDTTGVVTVGRVRESAVNRLPPRRGDDTREIEDENPAKQETDDRGDGRLDERTLDL